MELYIDRDEFCHGLARAQGVAVTRSTQPACSHVLLTSQAAAQVQGLRITATDTKVTYQGDLAANVKSPGSVAVNSAQLFQIVRAMPAVTVRLATKSGGGGKSGVSGLEVGSGRVSFRLPSIPEEEFPFLADFKPTATATLAERVCALYGDAGRQEGCAALRVGLCIAAGGCCGAHRPLK